MNRRTAAPLLLLAASSLVALTACSPAATEPADASGADADAVSIALVRQIGSGDYFEQWLAGAEAEAERLGVDLSVSDANNDDAQQALDVESAVNAGVDAIVVDHGFTETLQPQVAAALDAGIPVVGFDVDTGDERAISVSQSDHDLARAVLDRLVEDTGGEGEVLYVYVAGYAPLDRRDEVWQDVLEENPGLEQVAQVGVVNDSTAAGVADQAKAALQANPGTTAIFAPYDEFAKGATLAVQELGLEDSVRIYGADISTADIEVLTAEGSPWVATAATDPANVAAVTVRAAYLAATGGDVPASVEVSPTLLTAEDLRERGVTTIAELTDAFPELTTDDVVPVD
ncbi:substrate-binding domain-containing protein [Cellulomonas oligotrophica]|uniref:Simple sugar transport system substrate-binding protein n=1 Tax=Cellulomonas oligotrophica TaxID=931536 RepID=A0A7Y9FF26_9CELL|nr:substrate-binding domain-containing protein [Cellulomonas oligotrophica]NYD86141.1 simple sugar transport system substrate-binding protein [Cellulomonas oligotrophica]GIG30851.1 sugar ABC transporter substrate-binding protein [Cellulomonas oligotrophica]